MITIGFDLDGVISLLPFNQKQAMLTRYNEKFFWWLQRFKFLQRFYNSCLRKPNPEIKDLIKQLKEKGLGVIIISASNESYRLELERWLKKQGFHFDELYLKTTLGEDCLAYKKRMTSRCDYYFDDKLEIVDCINKGVDGDGRCVAFFYKDQKKEDLFVYLLPIFKILKPSD